MVQISDLELLVRRVLRATYVLTVLTLVGLDIVALSSHFLSNWQIVVFIALTSVATVFFALGLYFLSGQGRDLAVESGWWTKSGTVVLFILLPAFYVAFRYSLWTFETDAAVVRWLMVGHLIATLSLPFPLLDIVGAQSGLFEVQRFMKRVMWDPAPQFSYIPARLPRQTVWQQRRGLYQDRASISVFQRSLTCHTSDAEVIAEMLPAPRSAGTPLNVLDVGAGDGRFSGELFKRLGLRGWRTESVVAVDPVDFREEYLSRLPADVGNVEWICKRFQEVQVKETFNVVLAVHSLYEALDNQGTTMREGVMRWVLDRRKAGGHAVIAVGSSMGRAYEFKARALSYLFGPGITDTVGEDLLMLNSLRGGELRRTDSLIDLEEMLECAEAGQTSDLDKWLSYFLRYAVPRDAAAGQALRRLLAETVQSAASLPASLSEHLREVAGVESAHRVLPHKVCLWVV